MEHRGGIALLFVVLIMGLLASGASAATIEEEIVVSQKNLSSIEFIVEEPGRIYAELELNGAIEEIELILESPSGELKGDVWGDMPRYLEYKVSKEDLTEGKWQILVKSGSYERAYGTLKITYPSDTTSPTVIETTPTGENVPVTTRITITFSEPMIKESAEDASSIYPEVAGELYWEDNTMIFIPSSNLNYDTRYVVGIEGGDWGPMDLAGNIMVESYEWDFETVSRVPSNIAPTAYIRIYPNPAGEGERVTFEGYGEDEDGDGDGEVVECRWTFPDGRTFSDSGSSSWFTLGPEDVHAGWYSFAVRDDGGAWSEEVGVELELGTPPNIPWIWILPVIVLVIAAALIIRKVRKRREKGSIYADSNPQNALIYLDTAYSGLSPTTMHEVPLGNHNVKFRKFGYFDCEREAMVNANQKTHIHCDLTEIPGIKLKLSAELTEIPADGKSKSVITIRIEDKDGIPIPVPEDVRVELGTNIGTIESPVKIPAGHASVTATLTSSAAKGTATVKAKAEFLKGRTTVEFLQST